MKKIEDYIVVKNTISKDICQSLIDENNKKEWVKHTWYNNQKDKRYSEETKELYVMSCTREQQNKLTPAIIKALEEYQNICSWKDSITNSDTWLKQFSRIRFNRYEVGTLMRRHYDHIHNIFDGQRKGVPLVSIVANLNEDYEGSEFVCRDTKIKLKTGDILMFPSNFMYPHEVTECTKGTRYSFVSWAF